MDDTQIQVGTAVPRVVDGGTLAQRGSARVMRVEGYGLRDKEMRFVGELLKADGKVVEAYEKAFGNEEGLSDDAMLRRGRKIMERPRVRKRMMEVLGSKEISPEWVVGKIKEVIDGVGERSSDKLKALEMLAKVMKMLGAGSSEVTKNTINVNISEDTAIRLLERRRKHETGGRGDFIDIKG